MEEGASGESGTNNGRQDTPNLAPENLEIAINRAEIGPADWREKGGMKISSDNVMQVALPEPCRLIKNPSIARTQMQRDLPLHPRALFAKVDCLW